jgi:hypothetical protein
MPDGSRLSALQHHLARMTQRRESRRARSAVAAAETTPDRGPRRWGSRSASTLRGRQRMAEIRVDAIHRGVPDAVAAYEIIRFSPCMERILG